jgi:hypothetical protein
MDHYKKNPDVDYRSTRLLKIFNQNGAKWFSFCALLANTILLFVNFYIIYITSFKKYENDTKKQHVE